MRHRNNLAVLLFMGLAFTGLLAGSSSHAAEAVVIANSEVAETTVSSSTLKSIFLGKKKKWNDDSKVVLVALRGGDTADSFLKSQVGKTAKQFTTYWKKMVFTGKGSMPKLFDNEAELVNYVKNTRGAIGFVKAGTATDGAKTISIAP